MECKNCGVENEAGATFCKNCGSRLAESEQPDTACKEIEQAEVTEAEEVTQTVAAQPSEPKWKKILRITGYSLAALAALIALIGMLTAGISIRSDGVPDESITFIDMIKKLSDYAKNGDFFPIALVSSLTYVAGIIIVLTGFILTTVRFIQYLTGKSDKKFLGSAAKSVMAFVGASLAATSVGYLGMEGYEYTVGRSTETAMILSCALLLAGTICVTVATFTSRPLKIAVTKCVFAAVGIAAGTAVAFMGLKNGCVESGVTRAYLRFADGSFESVYMLECAAISNVAVIILSALAASAFFSLLDDNVKVAAIIDSAIACAFSLSMYLFVFASSLLLEKQEMINGPVVKIIFVVVVELAVAIATSITVKQMSKKAVANK